MNEEPLPDTTPRPGEPGYVNPPISGPSTIHPEQREKDAPEHHPHSVPVVVERISNAYFGHVVDGDHTAAHGVLYSVEGTPFASLGDAIIWCLKHVKSSEPKTESAPEAPPAVRVETLLEDGPADPAS